MFALTLILTDVKKSVLDQIAYTLTKKASREATEKNDGSGKQANKPKNVLIIGCSNGYGLASRITAAFGYGATVFGVSLEKAATKTRGGTPGWYHNSAFDAEAEKAGITSVTIMGDAFSDEVKQMVIEEAQKRSIAFDLIIYSLASPMRTDPVSGEVYKSVLKPIGEAFDGKQLDPFTAKFTRYI